VIVYIFYNLGKKVFLYVAYMYFKYGRLISFY